MKKIHKYKKRFYSLLESELGNVKPLLVEQKQIDLTKHNIDDFCKSVKVPKNLIDEVIPNIKTDVDGYIVRKKNKLISQVPKEEKGGLLYNKILKLSSEILDKIKPQIISIVENGLYYHYGYNNQYDENKMKTELIKTIYNEIYQKIENNFLIKNTLKATVNKKNVEYIKKEISGIFSDVDHALMFASSMVMVDLISDVRVKYYNNAPKCKEVVVVVDSSYNKLPKEKQYNPDSPPLELNFQSQFGFRKFLTPYITKIESLIDSYV